MSDQTSPSSPAGAPARVQGAADAPLSLPAVHRGDVVSALLAGLPTVLFTTIMAGAIAAQFTGSFITRVEPAVTALFVVIPGIGLAVFVRRWLITLRALAVGVGDEARWPFLLVPFFMVCGVACGVAFAAAATHSDKPGEHTVRISCQVILAGRHPRDVGAEVDLAAMALEESRCEAIGRECITRLLAKGNDTPAALSACIREGVEASDH